MMANVTDAAARKKTFDLERVFRASLEDVWALWTTKEGFESWWGPVGFQTSVLKIEPREGGELRYAMTATGAGESPSTGTGATIASTGASTGAGSGANGGLCFDGVPVNHRAASVVCDGGNVNPPGQENLCEQDSDCTLDGGGHEVCSCAPETRGYSGRSVNTCVPGDCAVDGDCPCGYCSPTFDSNCGPFYGFVGYYCHSGNDACINDGECDGGYCAFNQLVDHWACGYSFCAG